MREIRGRKALVTAADLPAGRSIALALATEGAQLYLAGASAAELDDTRSAVAAYGIEVKTEHFDAADASTASGLAKSVLAHWGRLHILINNTQKMDCGPTHLMSKERWQQTLSASLLTPIELVRALLPTLALQDEAHILNVCSILGLMPARDMAASQTAQSGLIGFTAALRAEYIRKGFGMSVLCTSFESTGNAAEKTGAKAISAIRKNKAVQFVSTSDALRWRAARLRPRLAAALEA